MNAYDSDIALNPVFPQGITPGGVQQVAFIPFLAPLVAGIGGLATGAAGLVTGAASLAAPIVSTVASGATSLAGTALTAGGAALGGVTQLAGGLWEGATGLVQGAGTMLFGGGAADPGLTIGEQMALEAQPGYYGVTEAAGGGVFDFLSADTLKNVASVGLGLYQSAEQRKLAEKAIEAQRRSGYVVGAPGTTALAPTTSVAIPAAAAAQRQLQTSSMIKYAIIALIAYFLFKGLK